MALITSAFGPWLQGVTDTRNPSIPPQSSFRYANNWIMVGVNEFTVRPGTTVALTFMDDAVTPAEVTTVIGDRPFMDGALAVAHSSVTDKCYLYRLNATMDGWYDSSGVLTSTLFPEPIAVLWDSMTDPPDVMIDEGLGTAYIFNTGAADENGLYWPTRYYEDFSTIGDLLVNGTGGGAGTDVAYFSGGVSYAQHLWGWGYGVGSTPGYTSYRPELARYSRPNFEPFQTVDSITLGDRVRTLRERIIGGAVAGNALFLMGGSLLTRVQGQGRDSWYKVQIDRSYGVVGPKAYVTAGDWLFYWSPQGPARITDSSNPDPLWDALPAAVSSVANSANIVAGFDQERNQVIFWYDTGVGVRTFCAFDTRRNVWLGPNADIGLPIHCAGYISPLFRSTVTAPVGPAAPPAIVSTTSVGNTTAIATWTNGDPLAQTEVSYKTQAGSTWTTVPLVAAGSTQYTFSGLTPGVDYEWRIRHVRNGQYSVYDGPEAASEFTTTSVTLLPPSGFSAFQITQPNKQCQANWTNSGESGVSTEVWIRTLPSGSFYKAVTAVPGASSATFIVGTYGSYQGKVRHTRSGSTASVYSATDDFVVSSLV